MTDRNPTQDHDHQCGQCQSALHAANVKIANLEAGLQTSRTIGVAIGILVERHKVTVAEAFDTLVSVSQGVHIKLRDVAAYLVDTGELLDDGTEILSRGHFAATNHAVPLQSCP